MDETREELAKYAHTAWAGWMQYMFGKCEFNPADGTMTVPKWAVDRWIRQMHTLYGSLPEEEKASDRAEADKMVAIITNAQSSALAQIRALLPFLTDDQRAYDLLEGYCGACGRPLAQNESCHCWNDE